MLKLKVVYITTHTRRRYKTVHKNFKFLRTKVLYNRLTKNGQVNASWEARFVNLDANLASPIVKHTNKNVKFVVGSIPTLSAVLSPTY